MPLSDLFLRFHTKRGYSSVGRASRSQSVVDNYSHVLPGALTCFFIGKTVVCTLSQVFSNELKIYHRCTKKWIKSAR